MSKEFGWTDKNSFSSLRKSNLPFLKKEYCFWVNGFVKTAKKTCCKICVFFVAEQKIFFRQWQKIKVKNNFCQWQKSILARSGRKNLLCGVILAQLQFNFLIFCVCCWKCFRRTPSKWIVVFSRKSFPPKAEKIVGFSLKRISTIYYFRLSFKWKRLVYLCENSCCKH